MKTNLAPDVEHCFLRDPTTVVVTFSLQKHCLKKQYLFRFRYIPYMSTSSFGIMQLKNNTFDSFQTNMDRTFLESQFLTVLSIIYS